MLFENNCFHREQYLRNWSARCRFRNVWRDFLTFPLFILFQNSTSFPSNAVFIVTSQLNTVKHAWKTFFTFHTLLLKSLKFKNELKPMQVCCFHQCYRRLAVWSKSFQSSKQRGPQINNGNPGIPGPELKILRWDPLTEAGTQASRKITANTTLTHIAWYVYCISCCFESTRNAYTYNK